MTLNAGGIVLCGGQSRRMGQPKAWLPFGGELMLQRVVRILSEAVQPVVVVAAPGQDLPRLAASVEVVRDERQGRGPLEGLATGLRGLKSMGADTAFASSIDAPFLRIEFINRVLSLLGDSWIAVPFVGERYHPLAATYRTVCLSAIDGLLVADRLRPMFLFKEVATREIEEGELIDVDPTLQSLRNLNTPEDYQLALRDFAMNQS
jgi:molybdopterin-guanine dinucleotide biosynthesis protein A